MAPGDSSLLNFTIARRKKAGVTPSGVSAEDSRPGACRKLLQDPKLQRRKGRFWSARQFGRILDGNRQAGGWMVHAELKCRPGFLEGFKGVLSSAVTYYSGDRHRTGANDNDTQKTMAISTKQTSYIFCNPPTESRQKMSERWLLCFENT